MKGSNDTWWPLVCSQNEGVNEYQRRANWLLYKSSSSPEAEKRARDSQSLKARGCCNLSPGNHIFHQTVSRLPVANHVFLGSCMVDICQQCNRDQLPIGDTWHTWDSALAVHPRTEWPGPGGWFRCMARREQFTHQAPARLSCADLGRAQSTRSILVRALWSTREPEWLRPLRAGSGKCTKHSSHLE